MNTKIHSGLLLTIITLSNILISPLANAGEFTDALTGGTVKADFRLRYESVEQDNLLKDADALTLRTRIGYTTGSVNNFSGTIEFEDSRQVAGSDEYSVPQTGFNAGEYSVIADPETTELEQGYLQYKTESFTGKLGRQVITLDNHRFVGHVGWRQDRQTFDALTLAYKASEKLNIKYAYIGQRERIFAEELDITSMDHLINVSYQTPIGKLTAYSYLLEIDSSIDNALDTTGLRLTGSANNFLYTLDIASQDSETGTIERSADYLFAEGGYKTKIITVKLGYESLGSDDGLYGFSTPLATLHKFNGWTDNFLSTPAQGLVDTYVAVSGKLAGGKLALIAHTFEADESTATVDDFGDEINIVYSKKFGKHYSAGIKYGAYTAGDVATGKVDTDKMWLWVGASF